VKVNKSITEVSPESAAECIVWSACTTNACAVHCAGVAGLLGWRLDEHRGRSGTRRVRDHGARLLYVCHHPGQLHLHADRRRYHPT